MVKQWLTSIILYAGKFFENQNRMVRGVAIEVRIEDTISGKASDNSGRHNGVLTR